MKIIHLSYSDLDGGAARGAYQQHKALLKAGVDSMMLVANKLSGDPSVIGPKKRGKDYLLSGIPPGLDRIFLKPYKNKSKSIFSPAIFSANIAPQVKEINPDLINLHWICEGFLRPENFTNLKKPLVWTLRDMWSFTGGCHYAEECQGYRNKCGSCPILGSQQENDISRKLWQRKSKSWQQLDLTLVAISNWLADCARESSLFKGRRIEVIPSSFDTSTFKPRSKIVARELLDLTQEKKLILFGAIAPSSDMRKGFQYLISALKKLAESNLAKDTELVIFGASEPKKRLELGLKATYMGKLFDDLTLSLVYAAADVMVVPSTQEAFGKTAAESLACGTPVVCFDSTGLKDIVEHKKNGYRAECFSYEDLAKGISWVLGNGELWEVLSDRALEKVEREFAAEHLAKSYIKLYEEILSSSSKS